MIYICRGYCVIFFSLDYKKVVVNIFCFIVYGPVGNVTEKAMALHSSTLSIGPAVTREQSPAFLRNSNGRLDLPGPTQEAA